MWSAAVIEKVLSGCMVIVALSELLAHLIS